ncbi:MAG: DUF1573 domain-containing protein [Planctomycetes bacterium]|nr:DUF1573 domain-containing protein [Planctomycetota bacterium]MCB9870551.1 DUF1573 domain-containing protein [Planctomycetota bacterium]MCB9889719.1 DUF1573 domain-containing protein [Planctomycetota bacterium]
MAARPLLLTAVLAAAACLLPATLAHHGPAAVRRILRGIQLGVYEFGPGRAAQLVFADTHRKIAAIPPHTERAVEFRFRNRGGSAVRLVRTASSCGCARVEIPSDPIPPGGDGKVVVVITTKDRTEGSMWILARAYSDAAPDAPYVLMVETEVRR